MTKQELIHRITQQTGFEESASRFVVETFFDVVKTAVVAGETVIIQRFGRFGPKRRARKVARNINRNTALVAEAHTIPHFKPSPEFVDQVRRQPSRPTSERQS